MCATVEGGGCFPATPDERVVPGDDKTTQFSGNPAAVDCGGTAVMAWLVLIVSGLLETVWAVALESSKGFSRLVPSLVFGVALLLSMGGLAYAMRTIPIGTGYAVWVGIGAVGAALYGMAALGDPVSVARIGCLLLIVSGAVGLKVLH
jgi:quaternary ammonium compound-resistance protein SugE